MIRHHGRLPLFKPALRAAIREDRKTQTRRIIFPQPEEIGFDPDCGSRAVTGTTWPLSYYELRGISWTDSPPLACPYGRPGETRYLLEPLAQFDGCAFYADDMAPVVTPAGPLLWRWKPKLLTSMYMPAAAARTFCKLTAIRAERLADITEAEALAEGTAIAKGDCYHVSGSKGKLAYSTARGCFMSVWGDLYGPDSCSANPWVWAITFRRIGARS